MPSSRAAESARFAAFFALIALSASACDQPSSKSGTPFAINVTAERPDPSLPLPDFALADQNGAAYTSEMMRDHVTVVDFVFTSCPSICPTLTEKMATLLPRTDDAVKFVSISVDPENDTAEKRIAFLEKHGKISPRWAFLSGDPKVVEDTVIHGFKIRVSHEKAGTLAHGEHFVIVDKALKIRGYFEATPNGLDELVARVRALESE